MEGTSSPAFSDSCCSLILLLLRKTTSRDSISSIAGSRGPISGLWFAVELRIEIGWQGDLLHTGLQDTWTLSFASAGAFCLVLLLLSDRENVNNPAFWWQTQDFCLHPNGKSYPNWTNCAWRHLFSYGSSWGMLLSNMSGGLWGFPVFLQTEGPWIQ